MRHPHAESEPSVTGERGRRGRVCNQGDLHRSKASGQEDNPFMTFISGDPALALASWSPSPWAARPAGMCGQSSLHFLGDSRGYSFRVWIRLQGFLHTLHLLDVILKDLGDMGRVKDFIGILRRMFIW